jgi:hypothetical protein
MKKRLLEAQKHARYHILTWISCVVREELQTDNVEMSKKMKEIYVLS